MTQNETLSALSDLYPDGDDWNAVEGVSEQFVVDWNNTIEIVIKDTDFSPDHNATLSRLTAHLLADALSARLATRADRDRYADALRPFEPVIAEAARAESIHGPLPIDAEPTSTLRAACAELEGYSRAELRYAHKPSALAILCEEVGEFARAETPEEQIAELTQIEAVCARYRAALAARS